MNFIPTLMQAKSFNKRATIIVRVNKYITCPEVNLIKTKKQKLNHQPGSKNYIR